MPHLKRENTVGGFNEQTGAYLAKLQINTIYYFTK